MPPSLSPSNPSEGAVPEHHVDLRTTQDIVWSCLATIFACTWVALHPNLPDPQDTKLNQLKKRAGIMVVALVAPEFVLLWSMKQRIAAGVIARKYSQTILRLRPHQRCSRGEDCPRHTKSTLGPQRWTVVHGFFIQMGGLMLVDGNTGCPVCVLGFSLLQRLTQSGAVAPVEISEEAICDKSKGDFLTKLIVTLQTSWFVVQCLARWASKLPVTELEVMTFSFALLNVMTYVILWNKPQNVVVPMNVPQKGGRESTNTSYRNEEMDITDAPFLQREPEIISFEDERIQPELGKIIRECFRGFRKVASFFWVGKLLQGIGRIIWGGSPELQEQSVISTLLFHGEPTPFDGELEAPSKIVPSGPHSVPSFYAEEQVVSIAHGVGLLVFGIMTGALFGGLHLIPWKAEFPTFIESIIWRVSALCIIVSPIMVSFHLLLRGYVTFRRSARVYGIVSPAFRFLLDLGAFYVLALVTRIATLLYIASRLSLILLAFTTLRSLHPDSFKDIPWNSYIPHI